MRPSWDEYFMAMVEQVATRATCDRGRNGCVIMRDNRIITTGYVGSPSGSDHCDDVGHLFKETRGDDGIKRVHCVRTIHAEQNAILQAAKYGQSLVGATLYTKMEPCRNCAMYIASVGIRRVIAKRHYHAAQDTRAILAAASVGLTVLESTFETYVHQVADIPDPCGGPFPGIKTVPPGVHTCRPPAIANIGQKFICDCGQKWELWMGTGKTQNQWREVK